MSIPPFHSAFIRTELFLTYSWRLRDWLAAAKGRTALLCLLQKDFIVLTDNPTVSAILENDIPFERNVSTVDFCASVIETTSYFT